MRGGVPHPRRFTSARHCAAISSPSQVHGGSVGQVGPRSGSVDPGYGTALLTRVVGEKKAREIWYLCRRYSGREAEAMGLANICVPDDELDNTVEAWAAEICERSPTAIAIAKRSFNMDTAHQAGIAGMGMMALKLYYETAESKEGVNALEEKRTKPGPRLRQLKGRGRRSGRGPPRPNRKGSNGEQGVVEEFVVGERSPFSLPGERTRCGRGCPRSGHWRRRSGRLHVRNRVARGPRSRR